MGGGNLRGHIVRHVRTPRRHVRKGERVGWGDVGKNESRFREGGLRDCPTYACLIETEAVKGSGAKLDDA